MIKEVFCERCGTITEHHIGQCTECLRRDSDNENIRWRTLNQHSRTEELRKQMELIRKELKRLSEEVHKLHEGK